MIRPRPRPTAPLLLALAVIGSLAAGCLGGQVTTILSTVGDSAPPVAASPAPPAGAGTCPTSQPPPLAPGETAGVTLTTAKGPIVIKVDGGLGPNAAGNFLALVRCRYYDGVVFHRLVPGFVIQAGDGQFGRAPNVDPRVGQGGPGYEFPDDPVTVPYTRGVVAMANSGPDSNGSQFFIVLDNIGLDPLYSVFGTVTLGMDVVDAIAAMPNGGGQDNRALEPVPITTASVDQ
ncbi:MAG: peptidylprolyl isomerase [Candidatus Limnocylindrales bacterium]